MSATQLHRTSVLEASAEAATRSESEFDIAKAKPAARFSLRINPELVGGKSPVAGFDLQQPINRLAGTDKMSMRLGPDEWFLVADEQDPAELFHDVQQAIGDTHHSLVDISHRNIALVLSGPCTTDVLNTGCALDFHASAFPESMATRTVFAKAEVIIARLPGESTYRIECWRSFGRYLEAFFRNSARLNGIGGA
ncbi:MAG: sarcosine oxidase subunit gamma family protein [Pseudomonadota bacterium]